MYIHRLAMYMYICASCYLDYSSAPVSMGNTFQDLLWLCEMVDNNEHYICDIHVTYINTVKFN
jgi:hypothetical protein